MTIRTPEPSSTGSLYRKWRPPDFGELVGQDHVLAPLQTALNTGRIPHAVLLSGPRGSGKTSVAKILARCIVCAAGPTATPDNTCIHCRAVLNGTALDVLEIDAASNRGVDDIRALRDSVRFPPTSMRAKVFIIDEVHMLTKESANAFLKTLEEPPPNVHFVLATTAPDALPATILSRCQRYAFRRIPLDTIVDRLRVIADAEGIGYDDAALQAIALRADGALREALTMLEQCAAAGNRHLSADVVRTTLGLESRDRAEHVIRDLVAPNPGAVLTAIAALNDAGQDMAYLTKTLTEVLRNMLVAHIDPNLLTRELPTDDAIRIAALGLTVNQNRIVRALRLLNEAYAAGKTSAPRLELETALLRFMLEPEPVSVAAISARVSLLESRIPS